MRLKWDLNGVGNRDVLHSCFLPSSTHSLTHSTHSLTHSLTAKRITVLSQVAFLKATSGSGFHWLRDLPEDAPACFSSTFETLLDDVEDPITQFKAI